MSLSTVRRERLIGPLGLILLVTLFALAFYILKPSSVPGDPVSVRLEQSGWSEEAVLALDELDLAYIKAKQATGDISDAEVVKVILTMMQAGRVQDAKLMLAQYPQLQIDAQSRSLIDLELAAAQSDVELAAALQQLEQKRHLHTVGTLQRAIELSKRVQQPRLTRELYLTLASREDVQQEQVYRECGEFLAQKNLLEQASGCYASALNLTEDDALAFDIRLGLLKLLPARSAEQQALVDSLLNDESLYTQQWNRLAPALLAAERPDAAFRIHARLAMSDNDNATKWLSEAATWAQAANSLTDAAVFFDALAKRTEGQQRHEYQQEAIRVLVAAGEDKQAFDRLQQQLNGELLLTDSAQNRQQRHEQLTRGVELARQLGKTEQALEWNTQRLALDPDNVVLLATQAELALAASDLPLALTVARRTVAASPTDIAARESLARVSEWNALPEEASDQWLWLSKPDNQPDEPERLQALREVVRLGQATFQSARAASALRELTLLSSPADDDVLRLVELYELEGLPHEAANALNDIMVIHGKSPFVLRTLAMHQYRTKKYVESLVAWQQYNDLYGGSSEAVIYQMELLWRMDRKEQAVDVADHLRGRSLLSQASDYQLRVMAELAWQYRKPWLAELVQPSLLTLEEYDLRMLYGRRSLVKMQEQGSDNAALTEAVRLWQNTGETTFALTAMQLAFKSGDQKALDKFLPEHGVSSDLQRMPDYWTRLARIRLRNGDKDGARTAYEQAFKLDPDHVESIAGVLWMDIAEADFVRLQDSLQRFRDVAASEPSLWEAMAVGYLELGAAVTSVQWFDKLLDQLDTDYSMLLTYADALEYAGRSADAQRVRRYTLVELRPVLATGTVEEKSLLLRQYARLSARYGSSNDNETLVQALVDDLQTEQYVDAQDALWREDVAISWLMSTQRHEQARIVMTNRHASRLQAPVWQRLALALKDQDKQAVQAIVDAQGPLSIGNHILALRQLGLNRQAYALAQNALSPDTRNRKMSPSDLRSVSELYASLRADLPSYVAATINSRDIAGINAMQRGVSVRHSFIGMPFGIGLDVSERQLSANEFNYDGDDEIGDVALSLFFGNPSLGGRITAGVLTADEGNQTYANAQWQYRSSNNKRLYGVEAAYRELLSNSGELYLGARQNRATASVDASLGVLPYVRLQADATQINTRVSEERFADGLAAQAELGLRGSRAGNNWSANVLAGQISYQLSDSLPDELRLQDDSTAASVLQEVSRRLSIGGSVSRGSVNGGYPQSGSARYYFNARLGQSYPSREVGLSADAGAGFRVLGGDELSFSVSHDTRGVSRSRGTFTTLGVNYRYHF